MLFNYSIIRGRLGVNDSVGWLSLTPCFDNLPCTESSHNFNDMIGEDMLDECLNPSGPFQCQHHGRRRCHLSSICHWEAPACITACVGGIQ